MKDEALHYHKKKPEGKLEIQSTKKVDSEWQLSLAYSPGVAEPCKEIAKNPQTVFDYTGKGNLVAVVSNGSAVLGLGSIGPLAAKPVMEGKAVLFKKFAGINVFDIEIKAKTVEEFVTVCKSLEPTFGGINLEDIASPECFEIERILEEEMDIPVFHDDQHGTAIITSAAFLNACYLQNKKIEQVNVVFSGAGAAALSCAKFLLCLGVKKEHIILCDSIGVIYKGRTERMNKYKQEYAVQTKHRTLAEAINKADVFIGLSVKDILTSAMLKSMAEKPIVFAMANPDPEIHPDLAKQTRSDVIVATGRSDYHNQVNNVLGFPFLFRGALDVQARYINQEMKLSAIQALADLARKTVPHSVSKAYAGEDFQFGPDYIIPKPFDLRVLTSVAPAVAKAAMDSGVARKPIKDFIAYVQELETFQSESRAFV
ncbi:MAG: NADP-dependent malic enzyme, partial [Oligoflexia bacterium]|nr:NADP-dependent malic enzyme [Oligoflexia bacterium]